MTYRSVLNSAAGRLVASPTPYLDAVVLLAHALGIRKEDIYARLTDEVPAEAAKLLDRFIERRCAGYPVSYIRNRKEFYDLSFFVDERVLVPRPETELLVEECAALLDRRPSFGSLHDAFCGSGAVAVTLKHLYPDVAVSASDISPEALDVAARNSRSILGCEIPLYRSDILSSVPGDFDIICANPPYLTEAETADLMRHNWPEPRCALFGGRDGLDFIRKLTDQALDCLRMGGYLLIEAGITQIETIKSMMAEKGYADIYTRPDLSGRNRICCGSKE
jgi:release factor glutamine methyltransferase